MSSQSSSYWICLLYSMLSLRSVPAARRAAESYRITSGGHWSNPSSTAAQAWSHRAHLASASHLLGAVDLLRKKPLRVGWWAQKLQAIRVVLNRVAAAEFAEPARGWEFSPIINTELNQDRPSLSIYGCPGTYVNTVANSCLILIH